MLLNNRNNVDSETCVDDQTRAILQNDRMLLIQMIKQEKETPREKQRVEQNIKLQDKQDAASD
jgi:hypothetical protein